MISRGPTTRPDAGAIMRDLLVIDDFADLHTCRQLIAVHRRFGSLTPSGDNAFFLPKTRSRDARAFQIARALVVRIQALIADHFRVEVGCDLAILCAIIAGFRHTLHADNARVVCPTHGGDAEELRRVGCQCDDIRLEPNHTSWRDYSAILYLSSEHEGGSIVFGEGPNVYGRLYRKEIAPKAGLLVLCPSNELYFHHTTLVTRGARYSMNTWFTADRAHLGPDWV
jgi:2-oxoglutarate-Fe(II)-dependent oxygenase superfamily protein